MHFKGCSSGAVSHEKIAVLKISIFVLCAVKDESDSSKNEYLGDAAPFEASY